MESEGRSRRNFWSPLDGGVDSTSADSQTEREAFFDEKSPRISLLTKTGTGVKLPKGHHWPGAPLIPTPSEGCLFRSLPSRRRNRPPWAQRGGASRAGAPSPTESPATPSGPRHLESRRLERDDVLSQDPIMETP